MGACSKKETNRNEECTSFENKRNTIKLTYCNHNYHKKKEYHSQIARKSNRRFIWVKNSIPLKWYTSNEIGRKSAS